MTTDKMRAEFEASHLYADYHTPEEIEFDFVEFSRGWQAGVLAERERAAKVCESEHVGEDVYSAGADETDESYNAALRCAADAIRKGETP